MSLEKHIQNREWLMRRIRAEVVGPDPSGDSIVPVGGAKLPDCTWPEFRKPRRQENGEEVLWQDSPLKRYGAGILYPAGSPLTETESGTGTEEGTLLVDEPQQDGVVESADESFLSRDISNADESEDYDVSLANAMSPSAVGLSFLVDLSKINDDIIVELANIGRTSSEEILETASATYRRVPVSVRDDKGNISERVVWLRTPLKDSDGGFPKVTVYNSEIKEEKIAPIRKPVPGVDGLEAVIVVRRWKHSGSTHFNHRLLTVTFVNRKSRPGGGDDENSIFQAGVRVSSKSKSGWIVPYPESGSNHSVSPQDTLSDEAINKVLYRDHQAYAIGHGCAADWTHSVEGAVSTIWSDVLPVYETPSTTAELEFTDDEGQLAKLRVSMRKLAGLDPGDSGRGEVSLLLSEYERWIQKLRLKELSELDNTLAETGEALIQRCEWCLARIRDGVSLLESEGPMGQLARRAFALANHAMLIAQLRGGAKVRNPALFHSVWNRSPANAFLSHTP